MVPFDGSTGRLDWRCEERAKYKHRKNSTFKGTTSDIGQPRGTLVNPKPQYDPLATFASLQAWSYQVGELSRTENKGLSVTVASYLQAPRYVLVNN